MNIFYYKIFNPVYETYIYYMRDNRKRTSSENTSVTPIFHMGVEAGNASPFLAVKAGGV